jgi:arsenate reductase
MPIPPAAAPIQKSIQRLSHSSKSSNTRCIRIKPESWDDFATPGSPPLDFVFTLADETIGETCPVWPGQPITAHWGIEDPIPGEHEDTERKVRGAYHALQHRLGLFLSLPLDTIDGLSLQRQLNEIGSMDTQTAKSGAE